MNMSVTLGRNSRAAGSPSPRSSRTFPQWRFLVAARGQWQGWPILTHKHWLQVLQLQRQDRLVFISYPTVHTHHLGRMAEWGDGEREIQRTHHTVGHDGDDDDPLKGGPGDKPHEQAPEGPKFERRSGCQRSPGNLELFPKHVLFSWCLVLSTN
jgi:hypothetical protein